MPRATERAASVIAVSNVRWRAAVVRVVSPTAVSYTHLRAHETVLDLVCRLLLEKKNKDELNLLKAYVHEGRERVNDIYE